MRIELKAIGFVHTEAEELPRHWSASDVEGTLIIDEQYSEGLSDIEPGQRIVVMSGHAGWYVHTRHQAPHRR